MKNKKEHIIVQTDDGTFELFPDPDGKCSGCYYSMHIGDHSICQYKLKNNTCSVPCLPDNIVPGFILVKINDETQIKF